jgi:putative intracellular protease/amidase
VPAQRKFAGKTIIATTVAIVKAGDGLSQSLAADGTDDIELGGHYFVLMEVEAKGVALDVSKDDPRSLLAKVKLQAGTVTLVDKDLAAPLLAEQADRNEQARIDAEEAKGITRLDFPGEADPDAQDD